MLALLFLKPPGRREEPAHDEDESSGPEAEARPGGLGDQTLVAFDPEVRAVVPAPCPSDMRYPIGAARRVDLAWGHGVSGRGTMRFKAAVKTRDGRTEALVAEDLTLGAREGPRWFSRVFDLPAGAEGGTLMLRTRGSSPASFWAAPVFSGYPDAAARTSAILVSLDTVRADHLNAYGYTRRPTSPDFDAWAGKGTLFEAAMSTAPGTLSSQMSILTGRYPSHHGVSYSSWRRHGRMPVLPLDIPTLAEVLGNQGFLTAAFTGSGYFALPLGYSRGFREFVSTHDGALGSAANVFEKAFAWLERHRDDPFFLFVHTYEAHEPYQDDRFLKQEGGAPDARARNEALYDGDIRQADTYLGKLRRRLERLGLASRTLVVVVSDHGEEFGDHFPVWNDGHGHSLFAEQVHVPFLVAGPTVPKGQRIKQVVDLTVVTPTILDLLGVEGPGGMDGHSVRGLLGAGPEGEEEGLAFSEDVWIGRATRAARSRTWKLIERGETLPELFLDREARRLISREVDALPPRMLFHLPSDPRERENRLAGEQKVAARLGRSLDEKLAGGSRGPTESAIEVEGEVLDRLRALGYLR